MYTYFCIFSHFGLFMNYWFNICVAMLWDVTAPKFLN